MDIIQQKHAQRLQWAWERLHQEVNYCERPGFDDMRTLYAIVEKTFGAECCDWEYAPREEPGADGTRPACSFWIGFAHNTTHARVTLVPSVRVVFDGDDWDSASCGEWLVNRAVEAGVQLHGTHEYLLMALAPVDEHDCSPLEGAIAVVDVGDGDFDFAAGWGKALEAAHAADAGIDRVGGSGRPTWVVPIDTIAWPDALRDRLYDRDPMRVDYWPFGSMSLAEVGAVELDARYASVEATYLWSGTSRRPAFLWIVADKYSCDYRTPYVHAAALPDITPYVERLETEDDDTDLEDDQ